MPIYEYQCEECGHRLEKIQKISDDPLKDCPNCAKPGLNKLVSAAAFRLKGSGWYETDFKTGSKKNVLHGVNSDSSSASGGSADTAGAGSTGDSKSGDSKSGDSKSSTASAATTS
ncbi:MAG: zinc ribbon domain-containing protein [Pseudomonadales bacterium]|nr:zinc ribbon domain-containing protein [Pseudomonadales bacterium]